MPSRWCYAFLFRLLGCQCECPSGHMTVHLRDVGEQSERNLGERKPGVIVIASKIEMYDVWVKLVNKFSVAAIQNLPDSR
jgi:hypothetical protein